MFEVRPPGFTARVGRAVLSPGRAAAGLCAGGPGGLSDVAWLLLLRLLATETVPLGKAALAVLDGTEGPMALVLVLRALTPDLLLITVGAVAMALLLGQHERALRPGLVTDLSAQAWIGWMAVHVLGVLALNLAGHRPSPALQTGLQIAALCAFALLWGYAWRAARSAARTIEELPRAPHGDDAEPTPPDHPDAG